MKDMIEKLGLAPSLKDELNALISTNENKIHALSKRCHDKGFNCLNKESDIMRLAVCIDYTKYTKEIYQKLGISDDILFATLGDIAIWCKNNDNKGLKNFSWIKNHLNGELFRIGRLQYQLYTCDNKALKYKLLPFDYGENVIYVHIPQGEKLIYADCISSIKQAKKFFDTHFPSYHYRFFFCESWLLYEDNWMFMEASSNILQFQSMFEIVYNKNDPHQAIERIFGKRELIKSRYSEDTSLQKSAKNHIINGGKLGEGIGLISINDV